jgi:hypothetical protein
MKHRNRRVIVVATGIVVLLFLVFYIATGRKWIVYQDQVSHSIKRVQYWGCIKICSEVLWHPEPISRQEPLWQKGVELAYRRPVKQGEVIVYNKNNVLTLIRVSSIQSDSVEYELQIGGTAEWIRGCQKNAIVWPNGSLSWSFHRRGEIFIYADDYWKKNTNALYRVSYPIDPSKLKLSTLTQLTTIKWCCFPWDIEVEGITGGQSNGAGPHYLQTTINNSLP